jgi:hypothetical protein
LPLLLDQPKAKEPLTAKHITRVSLPTITGLALLPDGQRLILLGRSQLFEFTPPKTPAADASEPYGRMLKAEPRPLAKPKQKQGEAVCFGRDGSKLYVASEGKEQPIWELDIRE